MFEILSQSWKQRSFAEHDHGRRVICKDIRHEANAAVWQIVTFDLLGECRTGWSEQNAIQPASKGCRSGYGRHRTNEKKSGKGERLVH